MEQEIEVVRVTRDNYDQFCRMIEWRLTGQDHADLSKYQGKALQDFFAKYHVLESDWFFVFAAKSGDRFIGWITAVLIPKPDPRLGTLYVDELWVAEGYRNQGVAARLMEEVLQLAKAMQLWRVRLYVSTDNSAGRHFYHKMGFTEKDDCRFCELNVQDIVPRSEK